MDKLPYEAPECQLVAFPAESSICSGSLDRPGEKMEEGANWYEY